MLLAVANHSPFPPAPMPSPGVQVPLQVGKAFCTAVQHSRNSAGTYAALCTLRLLLVTADASGLVKNGAAAGSLGSSIRQQLQQGCNVLPEYAAVMTAMAADLRREAATLKSLSGEELCSDLDRFAGSGDRLSRQAFTALCSMYHCLRRFWSSPDQTHLAKSCIWMSDPTGHAEAAMQLVVAALQHNSSTLQHVLPAVLQRAPEHTGALLGILQTRSEAVLTLGHDLGVLLSRTQAFAPETASSRGIAEQPLRSLIGRHSSGCAGCCCRRTACPVL